MSTFSILMMRVCYQRQEIYLPPLVICGWAESAFRCHDPPPDGDDECASCSQADDDAVVDGAAIYAEVVAHCQERHDERDDGHRQPNEKHSHDGSPYAVNRLIY